MVSHQDKKDESQSDESEGLGVQTVRAPIPIIKEEWLVASSEKS